MLTATYALLEAETAPLGMRRNLLLRGERFVTTEPTEEQIGRLGAVSAWTTSGVGPDLRGRDLRFADFSGADLRRARLNGANLRGANLEEARLDFADAESVRRRYAGACPGEAMGKECDTVFDRANLRSASLRGAKLRGARLALTDLKQADLTDADLFLAEAWAASFDEALLLRTRLDMADLDGASFRDAKLVRTQMGDVRARAADFGGAMMIHVEWEGVLHKTDLRGSSFVGADIVGWFPDQQNTDFADFRGATFFERPAPNFGPTVDLLGARVANVSDTHIENWTKALDPSDRSAVAEALKKVDGETEVGQLIDWDQKGFERRQTEIQNGIADLACGGEGGTALALGLVRRVKSRRSLNDLLEKANSDMGYGSDVTIAPFWSLLERRLTATSCKVSATAVRRAFQAW